MANRIDDSVKYNVINLYQQNAMTINAIAAKTGLTNQTVSDILADSGVRRKLGRLGDEGKKVIAELHAKGKTIQEIVAITGKSESTVRRYMN